MLLMKRTASPSQFNDVNFAIVSGLAERFAALTAGDSLVIGETCFGTGLNFLRTWQLFEQSAAAGASLDFFSVAEFPLDDDELRAELALSPELCVLADALLDRWRRRVPGWNRWNFCAGRVRLTLAISGVDEALAEAQGVDAWFVSGTVGNSEVRAQAIARASYPGATMAMHGCDAPVQKCFAAAGFVLEELPGEYDLLRGRLAGIAPARRTPASAIVVGGGIAGCAAAHALAVRGVAVTLVERAPMLASAASGNPRGILHARLGAAMNAQQRLVLAAYGHALALLDQHLRVDDVLRAECGLLQLAFSDKEATRIERLLAHEWPPHLLQRVDAAQASKLAGIELQQGGLWFPAGGWVAPPQWCARLADHPGIVQRAGHSVETLSPTETGWRVAGSDAMGRAWAHDAEIVVVCCAQQAQALPQFAHFPLTAVRGQITELPATPSSSALRAVVCADGYVTPAQDGRHLTGATHSLDDHSVEVRAADHAENVARLATRFPALLRALGEIDVEHLSGRAAVRCSAPGSMPLIGEVLPRLYCSLAHGTRGLLTAGLAGEMIAAAACQQLMPLPSSVIAALQPTVRTQGRNAGS